MNETLRTGNMLQEVETAATPDAQSYDFSVLIRHQLALATNLCSEVELKEQAVIAKNAFVDADNGDGEVNFDELKKICRTLGVKLSEEEEEAMANIDTDGTGTLDIVEWLTWWLKKVGSSPNPAKQMEVLAQVTFKKFDKDCSGSIDKSEFRALIKDLGADFTEEELDEAILMIDDDNSGDIELGEFVNFWCNRAAENRKSGGLISMKLRNLASKALVTYQTDIFTAAWEGQDDTVGLFVEADSRLVFSKDTSEFGDEWTALHYACYRGHMEVVAKLLGSVAGGPKQSALVNVTNRLGFTPLFYAAQRQHVDLVKLLLDSGADPCLYGCADPEESPDQFYCPADLACDFPRLKVILMDHPRCQKPSAVPVDKILPALVEGFSGLCSVDLPAALVLRGVSTLPIKKWKMQLNCRFDTKTDDPYYTVKPFKTVVRAKGPPGTQSMLQAKVDRGWFRAVRDKCDELVMADREKAMRKSQKKADRARAVREEAAEEGTAAESEHKQAEEDEEADLAYHRAALAAPVSDEDSVSRVIVTMQLWCMNALEDWSPASEEVRCEYLPVPPAVRDEPEAEAEAEGEATGAGAGAEGETEAKEGSGTKAGAANKEREGIRQLKKKGKELSPKKASSRDKVKGAGLRNPGVGSKVEDGEYSKSPFSKPAKVFPDGIPRDRDAQDDPPLGLSVSMEESNQYFSDFEESAPSSRSPSAKKKTTASKKTAKSPSKEPLRKVSNTHKARIPEEAATQAQAQAQEGEFSFADMVAQDEAMKRGEAPQAQAQAQEGEFSFADMVAQEEAMRARAPSGRPQSGRPTKRAGRVV